MIEQAIARGGVFHLWGHSWELEDEHQWERLGQVLAMLGQHRDRCPAVTNRDVLEAVDAQPPTTNP